MTRILGSMLVMALCDKIGGIKQLNSSYRPLMDDCHIQNGYCLDAPDVMPGGGWYNDTYMLKGVYEQNSPKMITVNRDD